METDHHVWAESPRVNFDVKNQPLVALFVVVQPNQKAFVWSLC